MTDFFFLSLNYRVPLSKRDYILDAGLRSTVSWIMASQAQIQVISLLVRVPDSWSKGCELESLQEWQENLLFVSQLCVLTLIWCLFHPCNTVVACKRPQSFCQKCRWQFTPKHAYTPDPLNSEWADYATVLAECGNLSGNKLTCNSSGNTYRHLSSLSHCGLILA